MQCRNCWGIHPKMTRLHPFTWLHLECANQGWYYIMYQSRQALLLQTFVTCQRWQRWYPNSTGPQLSKAMVQQFIGALVGLPKLKTNVTGKEPLSPSWLTCFTSWNGWITPLNLSLSCVFVYACSTGNVRKPVWVVLVQYEKAFQCFAVFLARSQGGCEWRL